MYKYIKYLFLWISSFLILSCTKDEKFEGSPSATNSNQKVENITGNIVSNTSFVLPGQLIDFTFTLPSDFVQKVNQNLKVQVSTLSFGNSIRTVSIDVPQGQSTASGKVLVGGGGGVFDGKVELFIKAIKLSEPSSTFYIINSNKVDVNSGSLGIPLEDESRLQIRIGWENKSSGNFVVSKISRDKSVAVTLKGSVFSASSIRIGTPVLTYPLNFTTTLEAAAAVFVSVNSANILANNPSINSITSSGKAIIFNYTSTAPPTIGFTSYPPGTGTGKITGKSFNSAFFESNGNLDRPRTQSIFNFQSPSSSNEEANTSLYNVGNYIVSIRPSIVEPESLNGDLKYRIILRKPDGSVVIYQGVYANSSSTSPEKSVLTFTKTGLGDNAVYDNFIFTP